MMMKNTLMTLAVPKHYEKNQRIMRSQVLHEAAMLGQGERIRTLCKGDVDVDARDAAGRTPLIRAAGLGHTEAVRALLDLHANMNAIDATGRNALKAAMGNGVWEIVALLLEHGAEV